MLLKFFKTNEIVEYLKFHKLLTYEGWVLNITGYRFNGIVFITQDELIGYLIDKQIVNEVAKPEIKYKGGYNIEYNLEYYLLNTNYLNVLTSNLFVNPEINLNRLLSINEVCELLSVTRPTVYKLINSGQIDSYNIQNQKKLKYRDVLNFIESNKSK